MALNIQSHPIATTTAAESMAAPTRVTPPPEETEHMTDMLRPVRRNRAYSSLHEETVIVFNDSPPVELMKRDRTYSFSLPEDLESPNKNATELYKKLATHVVTLYRDRKDSLQNGQLFICVAGGPGSGKSTLAEEVAKRVNRRIEESVCVLPMDGFHYTRAQLKELAESPDCVYTYEQLIARRGAPWTFDVEACVKSFRAARETGRGVFPIYDRDKDDPVPGQAVLMRKHGIVFLEGNYLLAWDDPHWAQLKGVFDETWYISCTTLEQQRERLIERHLRTWTEEKKRMWGEGSVGAANKADSNDVLNAAWIDETSRKHADLLIEST